MEPSDVPQDVSHDVKQNPDDAKQHAPKKVIGRPITKETARAYQISSTRSKRLRREARQKMLEALTTTMDLGQELSKAMKARDESYLKMIVQAAQLVGCHWDQSDEGREQRFNVKADTTVKSDGTVKFVIEEAKPEG